MSTRSYRGNRGKNVYEIANFSKGVNATNAAMPPGYLKELVNMNISPDGLSLRPREPYLNYALYLKREDEKKNEFVVLSNRVGMFISKQFPNWEFIIDFFGKRHGYEKKIEDYRIIDGDTFVDNKTGIKYRLLIVDAYELGTEEGQQAKEHLESITDGKPITVRYDSQAPSWVDKYNRHLVWAETKDGLNIQRSLIEKEHAKYLDLRVTEHEGGILNQFDNLLDYEENTMTVYDYPGGIPVVYRRDINQPPELVEGRPSYILYEFNNIFMGDMLNDLEMGYSFVPFIGINKVNSEFGRYRTEYNPLEQNKMPNHDGIVSLVNVHLNATYLVWNDTETTVHVLAGNGINDLPSPYNSISGSHIFATEEDLISFNLSSSGIKALITGHRWVRSTSSEYSVAGYKINKSANTGGHVVEADVNYLVIPTGELWEYGQWSVGLRIDDIGLGYSYWKLTKVDPTFQDHPKVYESVLEDITGPSWCQVSVNPSTPLEKYKGIITVDLDIPLKEDEMSPDFDNPRIVFNTYNKNVKKVRFEDLRSHSQNLLDNDPIDTEPLFGEKASENGYTYPTLRSFLFKNKDGEIVSQLQKNKIYTIEPLISLPELNEDNGYDEDYVGYAYKWEIIIHNNLLSSDGVPAIRTIPWNYVVDRYGTKEDIKAAFTPMSGTQEELLSEWDRKGISRRTQSLSGFPSSVASTQRGDIHRVPAGSTNTNIYTSHSRILYYENYYIDSEFEDVPIPETYKGSNPMPINGGLIVENVTVADGTTFEEWKNRDVPSYVSGPFKRIMEKSNRVSIGSAEVEYYSDIIAMPDEFDYFEYSELEDGLSSLKTSNKLFNNSGLGVQVRLWVSPVKSKESFTEEIEEMDLNAQILTSAYMPYQSEEILLPPLVNTSKIRESKYFTFFEDMLVLYGGDTFGNVIYLSDFSNIGYFPFKYALDQIPNEIIHIHPFQNVMIVFTRSDVWAIEKIETENEFGVITTDFIAKQVLQNVFIDEHLKNTIKTVGKYIMILLEDKVVFLKPNSFTGDVTDLSYMEVSTPIGAILKEPHTYVANRLKYYNIFDEEDLKFDLYADVDNKDFKIVLSTFIKTISKPYMIEFIFDGITGVWTIYDTLSTAYPIGKSGSLTYMKSHPELGGGITLTDVEGINKFKIMDKNQAHMDIDQYNYTESNITFNPTDHLKIPINTIINLGNMNISNHLNKRFHEIQYEMTNINSDGIDMAYEFKVDGRIQQTSDRVIMEINDFILDERQQIEFVTLEKRQQIDFENLDKKRQIDFETLKELSNMGFDSFLLDLSRFPISERITTRVAANGRGRIGSFRISFNITNDFEIFRFLIIYKEQTARKVSQ